MCIVIEIANISMTYISVKKKSEMWWLSSRFPVVLPLYMDGFHGFQVAIKILPT